MLVATGQDHHKDCTTLHEVHPVTGSVVDPQLADAMTYWFDITEVSIGYSVQSRRDASLGPNVTQATKPSVEGGGFDQFEHGLSVNYGLHMVNDVDAAVSGLEVLDAPQQEHRN